jgi:hypothetical protein
MEQGDRIILLVAGESGTGKSFFMANLRNALIIDTDIGGGLKYADAMIHANGSQRVGPGGRNRGTEWEQSIAEYPDLLEFLGRMDRQGKLSDYNTLAIDHITTIHDNGVMRHNPRMERDYGRGSDLATKEWKRIREFLRNKDFNLVCAAHLKGKWEADQQVGLQAAGPKELAGDFEQVLHLRRSASGGYPSVANVVKWRRLPNDPRGPVPAVFPFEFQNLVTIDGTDAFLRTREPVPEATPEQVAKLTNLLSVAKVDEKIIAKWYKAAGVESFDEMPAPIIVKCIKYVEDLMAKAAGKVA